MESNKRNKQNALRRITILNINPNEKEKEFFNVIDISYQNNTNFPMNQFDEYVDEDLNIKKLYQMVYIYIYIS